VNVKISKRARRDARRINERWAKHGNDPRIFAQELLDSLRHLRDIPHAGTPRATSKRPKRRRFLMEKSKCHLYFEVDEKREVLHVITIWNGQRGDEPRA
jgi:plasmid stabilization system protein ParE